MDSQEDREAPVAADFVHIFTVKDGKVSGFQEFTDTATFAEAYRG